MRYISMLLALLMLLFAFTGCHGAKQKLDEFEIPLVFDDSKEYNISFWAKNDTNITQVNIYKKTIEDFEKLYPNIHVELKLYTDYGKIYEDVLTNMMTGTTPNVCITYPDHIATYMSGQNTIVPLDSLMSHKGYGLGGAKLGFDSPKAEEIVPQFLEEGKIYGTQYALPYMRSTEACYVNKDFVEKLGYTLPETLTWDFVFEVSEAAMEKNSDGTFKLNGKKTLIPFVYKSTDNMMIQMLRQMDAPYSTEAGEIKIFNDTTKELLSDIAPHAESRAFSTFKISSYPANLLNAGECIFAVDSTAGATWMGSDAPLVDIPEEEIVNFETQVMTVPQFDTSDPKMISQGPSVCIFNKEDPQEVLASWLFTQYLLTDRVQIDYSCTEGYVPVTLKAQNSDEYREYLSRIGEDDHHYRVKIEAAKLLMDNVDKTFVTPVFNGSAALRNAAGAMIEDVTKSKRRKQKTDDAYYTGLYEEMRSLYGLDTIEVNQKYTADSIDVDKLLIEETGKVNNEPEVNEPKKEKTPLPTGSKVLIISFVSVWVLIIAYVVCDKIKQKTKIR
ncbi:MAG: extracellular solute-binding protein [Ruminococcaceae bacterium]|nr:extracellular solute-binding protein [Oscillospiraceae bacterium]